MAKSSPILRIGNAQAFWGDRCDAAAELLSQAPDLDYLTMDYLAEVSMSILAVQRERDPTAGYARDFVEVVASLAPYWNSGGQCRLVVNAGGLNPLGCAEACRNALEQAGGRAMKIAVITGDDVLDVIRKDAANPNYRSLDTLESLNAPAGMARPDSSKSAANVGSTPFAEPQNLASILDRLVTANAYVGAAPIAAALAGGAEIVITGRVADPSLVVGCCLHHFGWSETDWNRLAGATVAGHLIECGTQVTGGIFTDWLSLPDPARIGFPIVEISDDGSCVVTKPEGTGGVVNQWTVKEQLVYEIGDPGCYLSPDVAVSFLSLHVEEIGPNRIRISGAQGTPRPVTLKVSATYRDGYRAAGTLTMLGAHAVEKARRSADIVLRRVTEAGHELRRQIVECVPDDPEAHATVLRITVEAESKSAVERFSRELMPLITAGPPGTTGYAEGRPRVHPVFRYWPCLVDRNRVESKTEWIEVQGKRGITRPGIPAKSQAPGGTGSIADAGQNTKTLRDLALARSGDKGTGANIGVIARRPDDFEFLKTWLTPEVVADYFEADGVESVARYELPNLSALNFVLRGILRENLRTDAQGKGLGQRLLDLPLPKKAASS
jgi:hypothetical protein